MITGALQKPKMGIELPLENFKKSDGGIFEIFIFWPKIGTDPRKKRPFFEKMRFFHLKTAILAQKMKISKIPASLFLNFSRGSSMPIFGF